MFNAFKTSSWFTANSTNKNRNLFIITYVAEDAMPLDKNPLPNKFEGEIVRGKRTGLVRSSSLL